jgi:hypothetical protein
MTGPLFEAYAANCLLIGEQALHLGDGGWTRGLIRLSLSGCDLELRQEPWVITGTPWSDVRGIWRHTTTFRINNVSEQERDSAVDRVRALSELLSFITASEVAFFGWKHPVGPTTAHRWTSSGFTNYFIPVLDTHNGELVRSFLETAWPHFSRERARRKLGEVFHYLALGERGDTPLELQLAIQFVVLEQLKHSFAISNGYVFIAPFFHVPGTVKPSKASGRGFQALLQAMFGSLGMTPDLGDIVDLRNEILHSGLSARPFSELVAMKGNVIAIVREYLLRLLQYNGRFYTGQVGGIEALIP